MTEQEFDKLPSILQVAAFLGVAISAATFWIIGRKNRASLTDSGTGSPASNAELSKLQIQVANDKVRRDVEAALSATRQALYTRIDQVEDESRERDADLDKRLREAEISIGPRGKHR